MSYLLEAESQATRTKSLRHDLSFILQVRKLWPRKISNYAHKQAHLVRKAS